jgi:D-sedoheptulose 7-phosphate isomerase
VERIEKWGAQLAGRLQAGQRLLAAGNGGSAAQAQHMTAELVGRYARERQALSAICLHAETSSLTAISNDYGFEEAFARQVRAHGRPGDVLLALTTSGRSSNLIAAAQTAKEMGIVTWALTGGAPNPLASACDDAISLEGATATVQELHLVAIHILCAAIEDRITLS